MCSERAMSVRYCVRATVAVGVIGTVVWCETHGNGQEHAQYAAPSTLNDIAASGGQFANVSNSTATFVYHAAPLNLEQLLPYNRLVIQTSGLTPPVQSKTAIPATAADPFYQRRQQPKELGVAMSKLQPFWCATFQKFRARRA
jgi:hypothetical protein